MHAWVRQVREYNPPAEGAELSTAQAEQLKRDAEAKKAALEQWCKTAYGEVGVGVGGRRGTAHAVLEATIKDFSDSALSISACL